MKAIRLLALLSFLCGAVSAGAAGPPDLVEQLGKYLFFDMNLSVNGTQSCASCHAPEVGFTGPVSWINGAGAVMPGALEDRFGNRKPPSAAYAGDSPALRYDETQGRWFGGMFWDGRGTGWTLHDPLAEQAMGPFLNPLEMGMPGAKQVCLKVAHSSYSDLFEEVWGPGTLKEGYINKNVELTYERIARSLAVYERSAEVNTFSSKFDLFWDAATTEGKDVTKITFSTQGIGSGATASASIQSGRIGYVTVINGGSGYVVAPTVSFGGGGGGMGGGGGGMGSGATATATVTDGVVTAITVTSQGSGYGMNTRVNITAAAPYFWQNYRNLGLADAELQGLAAFNDPARGDCSRCHSLGPSMGNRPLFTDFSYRNIGTPKNPDNPFYSLPKKWNSDGADWVDYGLGGALRSLGYGPEVYDPELGKFKVPTLRNVDLRPYPEFVKAFSHNGFFKSLEEIIRFYTWRAHMATMGGGMGGEGSMGGEGMSPDPNMFPAPEVSQNLESLNFTMMGKGQQTVMMDQANILAFLKTLTDGFQP